MIARYVVAGLLLVLAAASPDARAQTADQDRKDPGSCAKIEDDKERLGCYDALFRATPQERFGAQAPATKEEIPELRARIAQVARRTRGEYEITLDNGQVWVQTEVKPQLTFRSGDAVVIRKASMGSYRLQHAGRRTSTTVFRLR